MLNYPRIGQPGLVVHITWTSHHSFQSFLDFRSGWYITERVRRELNLICIRKLEDFVHLRILVRTQDQPFCCEHGWVREQLRVTPSGCVLINVLLNVVVLCGPDSDPAAELSATLSLLLARRPRGVPLTVSHDEDQVLTFVPHTYQKLMLVGC